MTNRASRVLGCMILAMSFLVAGPALADKQKQPNKRAQVKAAEQLKKADRRRAAKQVKKARAKRRAKQSGSAALRKRTPASLHNRLMRMGSRARFAPALDPW